MADANDDAIRPRTRPRQRLLEGNPVEAVPHAIALVQIAIEPAREVVVVLASGEDRLLLFCDENGSGAASWGSS